MRRVQVTRSERMTLPHFERYRAACLVGEMWAGKKAPMRDTGASLVRPDCMIDYAHDGEHVDLRFTYYVEVP